MSAPYSLEQAADPAFPLRNPACLVAFKEPNASKHYTLRSDQEPALKCRRTSGKT